MKKLLFISVTILFFASCSTTQKTQTAKHLDITSTGVIQKPVVVDFEIEQTKVQGTAVGKSDILGGITALKDEAVANALKTQNADVLVEPNFTVTTKNQISTVEVTGYPARYKNFRNIEANDTTWLNATKDIFRAKIYETKRTDSTDKQPAKKMSTGSILGITLGSIGLALLLPLLLL